MILPKKYKAIIHSKTQLAPRVYQIRLQLSEPKLLEFTPGQIMMFQIDEFNKRAYSLGQVENEPDKIDIFVDTKPDGKAANFFKTVLEGTRCQFMAPYGAFILRASDNGKVFLAGSTGVAPIRSMIRGNYYDKEDKGDRGDKGNSEAPKFTLFFGVNLVEELFLVEEFRGLEKDFPSFRFVPVVLRPEKEWQGEMGLVVDPLLRDFANYKSSDFYLCGSKDMVDNIRQKLQEKGIPKEKIFNERF